MDILPIGDTSPQKTSMEYSRQINEDESGSVRHEGTGRGGVPHGLSTVYPMISSQTLQQVDYSITSKYVLSVRIFISAVYMFMCLLWDNVKREHQHRSVNSCIDYQVCINTDGTRTVIVV